MCSESSDDASNIRIDISVVCNGKVLGKTTISCGAIREDAFSYQRKFVTHSAHSPSFREKLHSVKRASLHISWTQSPISAFHSANPSRPETSGLGRNTTFPYQNRELISLETRLIFHKVYLFFNSVILCENLA